MRTCVGIPLLPLDGDGAPALGGLRWVLLGQFRFEAKKQTIICISSLLLVSGNSFPTWEMQNGARIYTPWPIPNSILDMS